METTPVIAITLLLGALGLKVTDSVKALTNLIFAQETKDTANKVVVTAKANRERALNDVVQFFLAWAIGVLTVLVLARTAWGDEITIGKEVLSGVSFINLLIFGLVFSSVAGTLHDFKKAVDESDSAKKPPLIPGTPTAPVDPPSYV